MPASEDVGARVSFHEPEVIEALYDQHGAHCYSLARRIVVDEHLAQDVVQDVFVALWSGDAGGFDPARGSIRSWLLQITHHRAVDGVRRNHRHASRNAGPASLPGLIADSHVEGAAWDSQRRRQITAALGELSPEQRRVVELAYFGGYTQVEIAILTSTPLGTVKTRTLAALRRLRASVDLTKVATEDGWSGAATPPVAASP